MNISLRTVAVLSAGISAADAFSPPSAVPRLRPSTPFSGRRATSFDTNDFDAVLGEGAAYQEAASALQSAASSSSSPVIRVPDGSPAATVTLASAVAAADIYGDDLDLALEEEGFGEGGLIAEEAAAPDPLMNNNILRRQAEKKAKRSETRSVVMRYVKNPLLLVKGKDFSDITLTILIPTFVAFLVAKKVSGLALGKMGIKADELYEQAAIDIAYHVGDYEEMEATYKEYKKKLWFEGAPNYINSELVKRLAVAYCTNVSVTPKSVSSLAYLLTMMKISDSEAAECFVMACRENAKSMAIASKVLFYSEHVFKDKAAKKKMAPLIKNLAEMFGGMEAVMVGQRDMATSAYRDAVAEAGPEQSKVTPGWKVLGLTKETATQIFDETKALGFLSREELWAKERDDYAMKERMAQERRQEALRNSIDKDGGVIDPDAEVDPDKRITDEDMQRGDDDDDDTGDSGPMSGGAKECTKCKYTLFIAAGREGRFFGSGFTCPECGAGRDQFKDVDIDLD